MVYMEVKNCPNCKSADRVKSGQISGRQRYKCKNCGYHYTRATKHGYPIEIKVQAIRMYLEGISFSAIARLLKVSVSLCYIGFVKLVRRF